MEYLLINFDRYPKNHWLLRFLLHESFQVFNNDIISDGIGIQMRKSCYFCKWSKILIGIMNQSMLSGLTTRSPFEIWKHWTAFSSWYGTFQQWASTIPHTGFKPRTFGPVREQLTSRSLSWYLTLWFTKHDLNAFMVLQPMA